MSIVEAIFNHQKLYPIADNSMKMSAGGKNWYAIPKQVTLLKGTPFYNALNDKTLEETGKTTRDCTVKVLYFIPKGGIVEGLNGVITAPCDLYNLGTRLYFMDSDGERYTSGYAKPEDVVNPKWGGKALLSHIYQAFRAITARKAVIAW